MLKTVEQCILEKKRKNRDRTLSRPFITAVARTNAEAKQRRSGQFGLDLGSVGLRVHFTYLRKSISHEVKEVIQLNNYTKLNCHLQAEVVTLMKLK